MTHNIGGLVIKMKELNSWIDSVSITRIEEDISFYENETDFLQGRHYKVIEELLRNRQKDLNLINFWHRHRQDVKFIGFNRRPQLGMNLKKYNKLVILIIEDIEREIKIIKRHSELSESSKIYLINEWRIEQKKIRSLASEQIIC